MPSQPKASVSNNRSRTNPTLEDPELASLPEREPGVRVGKKKNKHASTKRQESPDKTSESEIATDPSPPRGQSLVGQIPRSFPASRRPSNDDYLDELTATEKISDEHTPPQDSFNPGSGYGRSPPPELIPGFSYAASPPVQNSYIGRGGFNARSPPTSPPQAKARPVSYGGPPSSTYGYPRMSTSPYGHAMGPYGSPPALPHLPQQHFYNAQDIDLRIGNRATSGKTRPLTFLRFTRLPGSGLHSEAVFAGSESHLDILSYDSEKVNHIGSLPHLPGIVHDATFLTWGSGRDPFAELRPLVAISLHGAFSLESDLEERPSSRQFYGAPTDAGASVTSVVVYSLRRQIPVAELLRVPTPALQRLNPDLSELEVAAKDRLTLHASGDFLTVSSGASGEIFVFGVKQEETSPKFECMTKIWTTLQPRMQRRDSSHGRSADAGMSPADLGRGEQEELRPVLTLKGRWLAYCPAAASAPSIGAALGASVARPNSSVIMSRSAPSRPTISCEVDSPDVETLLSKVAKGAAQGIVRGSKWLGEMGMQAWRNWNADPLANPQPPTSYRSPVYSPQLAPSPFPPTHGEPVDVSSTEPELVSILDLRVLQTREPKKLSEPIPVLATFQPPGGCSFLSFSPNGLSLLTASRKGVAQYIWDLFQIRNPRTTILPHEDDLGGFTARVRQLAKYQRFSPSMIVDVQWEGPLGHRFAILTQNRTVHMFDLPATALRWPPPRKVKKIRPVSAPPEKSDSIQQSVAPAGWMAWSSTLASRTQPMLANLRGRAPSVSGGVSGIGTSGIGLASATGMRGGKVVAAGFSKSLGAATDTVAHIRHAGQSKLHLKVEAATGRIIWRIREGRTILCVLDISGVKNYYVRKTNPRERQSESVSVFDARKAVAHKLPGGLGPTFEHPPNEEGAHTDVTEGLNPGFWRPEPSGPTTTDATTAPLSHAEIETNAPYQPFHSDHRVSMSVYTDGTQMMESQMPTVSVIFQPQPRQPRSSSPDRWVFGGEIATTKLNITQSQKDSHQVQQHSEVYRETTIAPSRGDNEAEQIVSTTKRRKAKRRANDLSDTQILADQEEFFEDELEVLDFAADRV